MKLKHVWFVRSCAAGRVITCEITDGTVVRYVILGLWPWEKRQPPLVLLATMERDVTLVTFYLKLYGAPKSEKDHNQWHA